MSDRKPVDCLTEMRSALDGLAPDRRTALVVPDSTALSTFVQGWMLACAWGAGAPTFAEAISAAYTHLTAAVPETAVAPA